MLWLMSCPSGEGRCYGEGAKLSHWASINTLRCRFAIESPVPCGPAISRFGPACVGLTGTAARALFRWAILEAGDAAMQRDAARALQCRAPSVQPEVLGRVESGDIREMRQRQFPRTQLRAGRHC